MWYCLQAWFQWLSIYLQVIPCIPFHLFYKAAFLYKHIQRKRKAPSADFKFYVLILRMSEKSYLNRKSIILSGTMELATALRKTLETSLSLIMQDSICFWIASISAINPDAILLEFSVLRTSNHSWSMRCSGSSKHEVIVSFICFLFFSTMIMESSVLSLLLQHLSALMSILWLVLSNLHFLKHEKTIDKTLIVIKDTKVRQIKRCKFLLKVFFSSIFLYQELFMKYIIEVYRQNIL